MFYNHKYTQSYSPFFHVLTYCQTHTIMGVKNEKTNKTQSTNNRYDKTSIIRVKTKISYYQNIITNITIANNHTNDRKIIFIFYNSK